MDEDTMNHIMQIHAMLSEIGKQIKEIKEEIQSINNRYPHIHHCKERLN